MGLFEQFPYTNNHELNLDWILQKVKAVENAIANLTPSSEILKGYEKSDNISSARKLSPTGDFTGTIRGRDALLTLMQIDGNASALKYLADQFSDGQTGLVIDGGFFDSSGIHKSYNGGLF